MTRIALCGGGTAGHITPLLAVVEELRQRDPSSSLVVIGTEAGREAELMPPDVSLIHTLPRLPFPRKWGRYALSFPVRWWRAVKQTQSRLEQEGVDVVVGFGGYTAAPVYLAAKLAKVPLVIHEANALPGLANRLGSLLTRYVAVCFPGTKLPHARVVGMPMRRAITTINRHALKAAARRHFRLSATKPVLLVTGGSTGAQSLNATIFARIDALVGQGWQILHLVGPDNQPPALTPRGYVSVGYTDRMDLALASADFVISRAGAATVSEIGVVGLPAVFVPYHVGNGEQRRNAQFAQEAAAALVVSNQQFTPEWVDDELIPLLRDSPRRTMMATRMAALGVTDAASQVARMVLDASEAAPRRQVNDVTSAH